MRYLKGAAALATLCVLVAGLSACGGSGSSVTSLPSSTTAGVAGGADLLNQRCTACHNLDRVTAQRQSAEGWAAIVANMVARGARLTESEQATLVAYLAQTLAP